jgi:hypothetical protein
MTWHDEHSWMSNRALCVDNHAKRRKLNEYGASPQCQSLTEASFYGTSYPPPPAQQSSPSFINGYPCIQNGISYQSCGFEMQGMGQQMPYNGENPVGSMQENTYYGKVPVAFIQGARYCEPNFIAPAQDDTYYGQYSAVFIQETAYYGQNQDVPNDGSAYFDDRHNGESSTYTAGQIECYHSATYEQSLETSIVAGTQTMTARPSQTWGETNRGLVQGHPRSDAEAIVHDICYGMVNESA